MQDVLKADKANSFMFSLPREPGRAAAGARGFGVFPRMALANHSCRPTCVRWDTEGSCTTEVTSTLVAGEFADSDDGAAAAAYYDGAAAAGGNIESSSEEDAQEEEEEEDGSESAGDGSDSSSDDGRPDRGKQPMTVKRPDGRLIPVIAERGKYDVTAHLALRFRAIVDITPGMEITQSYVELGWPSSLAGSMVLPEMDPLDNEPIILDGDGDDDDDDDDDDSDDDDDDDDDDSIDDEGGEGNGGGGDLIADLTENGADDGDDDDDDDDDGSNSSDDDSSADSDAEATAAAVEAAIDAANADAAVAEGNIETNDLDEDEVNEMLNLEEMGQQDLAALAADFVSRGAYLLQEYGFDCTCDRCVIEAAPAPDEAAWQKHYEWMTRHLCSQESCSGTRTPCSHPDCTGEHAHLECHLCGDTVTESEVQLIVHALDYNDVDEGVDHGGYDDAEEVD